jgi:endoglucanase
MISSKSSPSPFAIAWKKLTQVALLLLAALCSSLALHAQNSSSLDTAPGVNSTPNTDINGDANAIPNTNSSTSTSPASTPTPTDASAPAPTPAPPVPSRPEQLQIVAQEAAKPSITPELKVSGNQLVTADGKVVVLQGVNVPMLAFSAIGENKTPFSVYFAITNWKANVVRLPVSDKYWFGGGKGQPAADAYRTLVDQSVGIAAANGAYIILDLHRFLTPDQSCVDFWKDAAARYKNNPAVLFDIFNEPHNTTWDVWRSGGSVPMKGKPPVQSVGMQALVDTVRGTGAMNIIVAGGLGYAYDLSGVLNGFALDDKGGNGIMYATHFYNWHKGWAAHILGVAEKYPVLVGETGADIHKMAFIPANAQEDPYTWAPDAIGFIQKNHLNWTAWSLHPKATPDLILDWNYTPTPYWGAFVKDALAGKQFDMKNMR